MYILLDSSLLSSKACNCSTPCRREEYDAIFSNSALDMDKVKLDISKLNKTDTILRKKQIALDMAAKVNLAYKVIWQ